MEQPPIEQPPAEQMGDSGPSIPRWAAYAAAGTAAILLACEGGSPGPITGSPGDSVTIKGYTDFYYNPGGRKCDQSRDPAVGVHVSKRIDGWVGISDAATTRGLPSLGSPCRSNSDDKDGLMWVTVDRTY